MKKFSKMSDTEMEIMKVIWESDAPLTNMRLLAVFESRKWKVTTVATFLTRLADKGFVVITKQKNTKHYSPAVTEKEYRRLEAQSFLDSMYNGSLKNFMAALCGDGIDAKEAAELKTWLERVDAVD